MVVVRVFTVVDEEGARGRLVLVDDVITSMFVVEDAIDVVVIDDEEEPQAAMPSIMTSNNGR